MRVAYLYIFIIIIPLRLSAIPRSLGENADLYLEKEKPILDSLFKSRNYELLLSETDRIENDVEFNKNSKAYLNLLAHKLRGNYAFSNYITTIQYGKKYLLLSAKETITTEIADVNLYLGNSYLYLQEYGIALDYYLKASELYQELNSFDRQLLAEENIALIFAETNDHAKAIERLKQSLPFVKSNKIQRIGLLYNSIGRSYVELNNYTSAKYYLDSAYNHAIKNKLKPEEAYACRSYGWLYLLQENFASSENYYKRSLAISDSLSDYREIFEAASLLSDFYTSLDNHEKSLEYSLKYIQLAAERNDFPSIVKFTDLIFDSYVKLEEYKSAVNIYAKYEAFRDSLENNQLKNEILMTQLRSNAANEVASLKQQEDLNNQTIQFQNTLLIISIAGIFLLIVISVIIYRSLLVNRRLSALNKEQSERLKQLDSAKSRFFANISHDLRTPLSLIMGSIEQVLLSNDIFLTNKGERQLKTGLINGQRIIHLTNEINELIKLEDSQLKIDKKYINLDHMVSLFVSMFNSMAEMKGIKLSYSKKILDHEPIVNIDIYQFEKVLFNLITNALKHSNQNDSVSVNLDISKETVELSIIDTGEGIPEENVPYIFERYYQAPEKTYKTQEGFGIGLALVKEIIDKHGAKIIVKSKQGSGSQFTIYLDLESNILDHQISKLHSLNYSQDTRDLFKDIDEIESQNRPIVSMNRKDDNGAVKAQTILLVEDHPEVRQFIHDIIEPFYHVITAENGKRALKVLESKEVDLITTDLMMPWFDGFELLEQLSEDEKLSKIPVLVLSARTSEEDKTRVLSHGVNDFLHKPFKAEELLKRIKNLLDRKSKWTHFNASINHNKKTLNDIERSLLEKVDAMIMAQIDDPNLAVPQLAAEIAVSERKFFRMIKKLTGTTPFDYIKETRLQYVNQLMIDKKISSPSEAAKHIGMNNVSHFNTQFKARFGKKPSDILQ